MMRICCLEMWWSAAIARGQWRSSWTNSSDQAGNSSPEAKTQTFLVPTLSICGVRQLGRPGYPIQSQRQSQAEAKCSNKGKASSDRNEFTIVAQPKYGPY